MSPYVPPAFAADDPAALAALIDAHPFATLITAAAPEPYVTHLPLVQNRPAGDRRRVVESLDADPSPDSRATAAWMRTHAPPDDDPRAR